MGQVNHYVLKRVSSAPGAVGARVLSVEQLHQGFNGGAIGGVYLHRGRLIGGIHGLRHRGGDSLGVGGVTTSRAHEGVFTNG